MLDQLSEFSFSNWAVRRDSNPHAFRHLVFIEACFTARLQWDVLFTTHLYQLQLRPTIPYRLSLVHNDPDKTHLVSGHIVINSRTVFLTQKRLLQVKLGVGLDTNSLVGLCQ